MTTSEDIVREIEQSFVLLGKASANYDNRYVSKVFRELGALRRRLAKEAAPLAVLATVVRRAYPGGAEHLAAVVGEAPAEAAADDMDVDATVDEVLPEVDLYIHLLVQVTLLDLGRLEQLDSFNDHVVRAVSSYNKRSLDLIGAKIWFYVARTRELRGDLLAVRPALLAALRTATLRHDDETTALVITLLLRNYLLTHDIAQAANLVEKTAFPEHTAGNALVARYYYYVAKINAIQLDYSTAHECCITSIRKCPQTTLAHGFVKTATKLSIVIELLMGDIPELKTFKSEDEASYQPYFEVTRAVKLGDLKLFSEVLKRYELQFEHDDNYTLILRLRQNVIKTGIRIILLLYSKISLKDICIKLHLDSEELTEYIVSKAIRDGVIEATINHEHGYMQSNELLDIYSTKLPQQDFNQRIRFCLLLHSDSVKGMRYPLESDKGDTKNVLESKDEEFDLIKAIEEGDLDDFMD